MRDGNLFMPTMTWRTVTPDNPVWDEIATPSHTGVLTEVFRTRYATRRSIHPTHSVAGFGPAVDTLLSRHQVDDTPVSENSPYGLMRDYETYILMIGVGLESVTAIHLPEETIAEDVYVRPPETSVRLRLPRSARHRAQGAGAAALAPRPRLSPIRPTAGGARPARGRRRSRAAPTRSWPCATCCATCLPPSSPIRRERCGAGAQASARS